MNEYVKELKRNKEFEEYKIVDDLKPGLRSINIKIKCISKNEEKDVVSRNTGAILRVTEALVGDESGCVYLSLWNDDIDKMEIDGIYKLTSVYTKVFRGSLRLNIGKYGNFEEIGSEQINEVNTENNLSDQFYPQPQRYRSSGGYGDSKFSSGNGGNGNGGSSGYSGRRKPNKWNRKNYYREKRY